MLRQPLTALDIGAEDIEEMEKVFSGLKRDRKRDRSILDFNMDGKEIKIETPTPTSSFSDTPLACTPSGNVGTPLPPLEAPGSTPLALDSSLGPNYRTPVQKGPPPAPMGL